MAGGYDVSVTLKLKDEVSSKLDNIKKKMDDVIKVAREYDDVLQKISKTILNMNGLYPSYPTIPSIPKGTTGKTSAKGTSTNVDQALDMLEDDDMVSFMKSRKFQLYELEKSIESNRQTFKLLKDEMKSAPRWQGIDASDIPVDQLKTVLLTSNKILNSTKSISDIFERSGENIEPIKTSLNSVNTLANTAKDAVNRLMQDVAKGGMTSTAEIDSAVASTSKLLDGLRTSYHQLMQAVRHANLPDEEVSNLNVAIGGLQQSVKNLDIDVSSVSKHLNNFVIDSKPFQYAKDDIEWLDKTIDELINTENVYQKEAVESATATNKFGSELDKTTTKAKKNNEVMSSLNSTIKRLGGMFVGYETVKTAFDWSDELTLTEGKLANLTDDVDEFMDKVYQMSQATRTSYMDNASQMAKMWQLTGGTDGIFDTEDKLLEFNELLNQAFVLGGSGTREINASMYQLTQALSSGRLQGDELRSLGENAPYLINTIVDSIEEMYNAGKDQSEWITLTYNDLKRLGAEGVLTSEVIADAVLNSADDIRAAYENITPTWEQTFQTLKNQVQKISQPILKTLNNMINSESFEKFTQSMMKMFAVAMGILLPILNLVMEIGAFISDNWSLIEPVIWGIVGALMAYWAYTKLATVASFAMSVAQGIALIQSKGLGVSMTENAVALGIYNTYTALATTLTGAFSAAKALLTGATWSAVVAEYGLLAPILAIVAAVVAAIGVLYAIIAVINKFTGASISATGIILGLLNIGLQSVLNVARTIWNIIVTLVENVCNIVKHPKDALTKMLYAVADVALVVFKAVLRSVESLVNAIIEGLDFVISKANKIPGVNISTIGKLDFTSWVDDWSTGIKKLQADGSDDYYDFSSLKAETVSLTEAWNDGYNAGENLVSGIKSIFDTDKYLNSDDMAPGMDDYLDSLTDYDIPNISGSTDLPDDLYDALDDIKGNTEDIDDLTEEELKYLKDIAEQRVINRFTTAEIKVTTNMNNNIASDRDIDGVVDYFQTILEKAVNSTAEKTNGAGVI